MRKETNESSFEEIMAEEWRTVKERETVIVKEEWGWGGEAIRVRKKGKVENNGVR